MEELVKVYEKHIVRKLFRMHKFGENHTIDKTNLLKGTKIFSKKQKKAFDAALKSLVNRKIVLYKKKEYAVDKRVYYLNTCLEEEIKNIIVK